METPRNFNLIPLKNPWNAVTSVLIADFTLCLILSFSSKNRLMEPCRFSGCEQLKQTVKSQHHFGIPQTVCDPAVCPADSRAARGSAGGAAAGTQSRQFWNQGWGRALIVIRLLGWEPFQEAAATIRGVQNAFFFISFSVLQLPKLLLF